EQGDRLHSWLERQHRRGPSDQPDEHARRTQDRRARAARRQERPGRIAVTLRPPAAVLLVAVMGVARTQPTTPSPGFTLADVTSAAGLHFTHYTGASGRKYLPEALGAGAAFVDIDNDGWQDVVVANGTEWSGPSTGSGQAPSTGSGQ